MENEQARDKSVMNGDLINAESIDEGGVMTDLLSLS